MTALSMRLSGFRNGVSARHGEITRAMWHDLWPDVEPPLTPITSITNGVHLPTWISPPLQALLDRYLPSGLAGAHAGGRRLDAGSRHSRRRVLGGAPAEQADAARLPARVRTPALGVRRDRPQAGRRVRAISATGTADHRVRASLRHLQASDTYVQRPGSPGPDPDRSGAPRAAHLRRQGAPGRRWRQTPHSGDLLALDRPAVPGAYRLRRGLRHAAGVPPLWWRRRLAQQSRVRRSRPAAPLA